MIMASDLGAASVSWCVTGSSNSSEYTVRNIAVLTLLCDSGQHRIREIAEKLKLTKPVISRAVDKLCADGLITRKIDPTDRRDRIIAATARGRALRAEMGGGTVQ